jgi:LysM repeat protein
MNRWLRLALAAFASVVIAVTGTITMPSPGALANEDAPVVTVAAKNSSVTVGADAKGLLYYSTDSGTTWTSSGGELSPHGVKSIVWNGSRFIASSYFQGASSVDGRTWSKFLLPVGSGYDPGNLISDTEFFTAGTMTVDQIQAFLNGKVHACQSGYVCMKDFRETTFSRDATVLCKAYEGAANETAAQILFKVSNACGVSVEALLVLIQKEMSLVTHTWPSKSRYDKATGYACPDTAPCDSRYFGFYNQVYNAAKQFKRYANPPGTTKFFTWLPIGRASQVRLHPNASCGTTPVVIKNQATAGLYYYTPYTPNTAAMVNVTSTGDGCSSYGNRNFWRIYNFWFKKPQEYTTLVTSTKGVTMAIDREGGVTVSTNLQIWTRPSTIPTASSANPVLELGRTRDGDFAVLTQAGTAFQSENGGLSWKTLAVNSSDGPVTTEVSHTVETGETLAQIATRYGVTVSAVATQNNIAEDATLSAGDVIRVTTTTIPSGPRSPVIPDPSVVTPSSQPPSGGVTDYVVKQGDTLLRIAFAHQTTVANLMSLNSITDASRIFVGQKLRVQPGSSKPLEPLVVKTAPGTVDYVVKRGDTLQKIARANKTTVAALTSLNSLSRPNRLLVGQKLKIPTKNSQTQSFHRVQAKDTLPIIAERRGTPIANLIRLNPGVAATGDLRDGTLIRIS